MKMINIIKFGRMRNNDHVQFHTDMKALVDAATPAALNIENVWVPYETAFSTLNSVFKVDSGSLKTAAIGSADVKRDKYWSSIYMRIRATLMCPFEREVEAALKLKRIFDLYGNVRQLSLTEESAALNNLVEDLEKEENTADCSTVGITRWVSALKDENNTVQQLVQERRAEAANKQSGDVKEAREAIDPLYEKIVSRINALVELEMATSEIENFIALLNKQIKDFEDMLANRQGRLNSDSNNEEEEPPIPGEEDK